MSWIALFGGLVVGAVAVYAVTRPKIEGLQVEKEQLLAHINSLNITVREQGNQMKTLTDYLKEKERRITELENSRNFAAQSYDQIISELESVSKQINDATVKQLLQEMIERAKARKQQKMQTMYR